MTGEENYNLVNNYNKINTVFTWKSPMYEIDYTCLQYIFFSLKNFY